jgi:alanine racemase
MPFVTIDGRGGGGFPVVGIDDHAAAREVMEYVLALGHRDVAVIAFADEPQLASRSHVKTQRFAGYRAAFDSHNRRLTAEVMVENAESSIAGGIAATRRLWDADRHPTAVVAMSDVIALGVLEYLEEIGVSVPAEVSVIGFDDIPEARIVRPQLTTVSQPGYEKGRRAGELLVNLIADTAVEPQHILPATLVKRATCAPIRTSATRS